LAAPTLTLLNHTELDDADVNTGWVNLTTGDTDLKVEGLASMSGITRSDGEDSYYDNGGAPSTGVGKTLRGWINTTNMPYMEDEANDGYQLWVYDGSTESNHITMFGSDTYFGGWFYFWQDMDAFTGPTLANVDRWGIEANHTGNSKNVINMWMDVLRYLDGYSFTGGTLGDEVTLADIEEADRGTTTLYGYGIIREVNGVYFGTGEVQIGSGATTTYFEMDGEVLVFVDPSGSLTVASGLYEINAQGSGCDCVIKNSVLKAAGTGDSTRFIFDFSDTDATVSITDNLIVRAAASTFGSGQTVTGNTFDDCGQITHGGADMDDCVFKNYEGTADTSYLIYDEAADPNGEMDNTEFTKGTAETHAIEFGTSSPTTMTLTGIAFSGYNAADDANNSTLYFARTSGTITVNLSGCTGNISYKAAGTTVVNFVADPVTTQVTVKDIDTQAVLEDARVLLLASSDAGDFPYQESVTSITRSTLRNLFDNDFEEEDLSEFSGSVTTHGTIAASDSANKNGDWGARAVFDGDGADLRVYETISDEETVYLRFWFRVSSGFIFDAVYQQMHLAGICHQATGSPNVSFKVQTQDPQTGWKFSINFNYSGFTSTASSLMTVHTDWMMCEFYSNNGGGTGDDTIRCKLWDHNLDSLWDSGDFTHASTDLAQTDIRFGGSDHTGDPQTDDYIDIDDCAAGTVDWIGDVGVGGNTATVTHTGHGLATGDFVFIEGADQDEYNGAFEIEVLTADTYTYTVGGSPTSPATGTIKATGGYFNTLTNAGGIVTDSRTISADQPVTGRARLSTSPDLYKSSPINETVDKDNGLSVTVYLIPDS